MIKFFRKIRPKLLSENKFSKYLMYAIGEIVLVVIGILIALSINNWNEQKRTEAEELKLLNAIYNTMNNSKWDFVLNKNIEANVSTGILLNQIENRLPYADSLDTHFQKAMYAWDEDLNKTAYETAKQFGLNFIINDITRAQLSNLYEVRQEIINKLERRQEDFHNFTTAEFLSDNFERINEGDNSKLKPLNYNVLMSNKKFEYILKSKQRGRNNLISWQQRIMNDIEQLKLHLNDEIKRFE